MDYSLHWLSSQCTGYQANAIIFLQKKYYYPFTFVYCFYTNIIIILSFVEWHTCTTMQQAVDTRSSLGARPPAPPEGRCIIEGGPARRTNSIAGGILECVK